MIIKRIVIIIQLRKYGVILISTLRIGLKKLRMGALLKKSASPILINPVMLPERIMKTGAISIIVR
jgi:hypothetical protein